MARFALVFKVILMVGVFCLGALSLLKGIGISLPLLKYDKVEARDIPAGVVLIAAGIVVAYVWRIKKTTETSTTTEETPAGKKTTTTTKSDENVRVDFD